MIYESLRDPSRWSLIEVLQWHADRTPDATFLQVVGAGKIGFADLFQRAERVATYLSDLDVGKDDPVVLFLQSGEDFVAAWFGLSRLNAIPVLLNTELKGAFLRHQLNDSGAKIAIADATQLAAIVGIAPELECLETVLLTDRNGRDIPVEAPFAISAFTRWQEHDRWDGPLPHSRDIGSIMYTSGTTGPSKGVRMPNAHCYLFGLGAVDNLGLTSDDRYYITLPLYHANGLLMQLGGALIAGARAILRTNFSASAWLDDVRRHEATVTNTLGVTAPFIFAQPASSKDRDHRLRLVMAAPNPHSLAKIWRDRFGVTEVVSGFGMTECNMPIWGRTGVEQPADSAGYVYDRYFEVKIVDPVTDQDKPDGEVGEIVVRPRAPFGFMASYHGLEDKTVEAWRNLWFHTGDAGVMNAHGVLTFVDRMRDCIRRRGHNIASFEVERAFLELKGVNEVAAYAVPASFVGGEDEIMVALVPEAGANLTPEMVALHAIKLLPKFALPRFIEIVKDLPKTPTGKIQKEKLRRRGVPEGVWDREAQ